MPKRKASSNFYDGKCEVCDGVYKHVRKHINWAHLPWYMCPAYACSDCHVSGDSSEMKHFHQGHHRITEESQIAAWHLLVNGFFLFVSRCLGLSIDALLGFVVAEQLFPTNSNYREEEEFYLREYDKLSGLDLKDVHTANPPTRVSELINHVTLTKLLTRLTPDQRDSAKVIFNYSNPDGSSPPVGHPVLKMGVIDAHFHLDEIMDRTSKSLLTLELEAKSTVNLVHAVANFVYPRKWGLLAKLVGADSRVSFTLGVHPHLLFKDTVDFMFSKLVRELEKHPEAVAVGEVGLDFTTTCRCAGAHNRKDCVKGKIEAQRVFLAKAIKLADQLGKPVVIHCRDKGNGSAAREVLQMFKSLGLTGLPVQRHCFMGNSQELDEWSSSLPNCYFSLSGKSIEDPNTREAILMCNHQRLLFETDSPYLAFPGDKVHHGPWRIGRVARAASNLMGMHVPELIRLSNSNAKKFFKLKW